MILRTFELNRFAASCTVEQSNFAR